jgi:mannosyltransferase
VVAFCPDQLGPAVSRVLERTGPAGMKQLTYPRGLPPERIDWADYARAIRSSPTRAFARRLVERAGPAHDVWLYWGRGYRPYGRRCANLERDLAALRPGKVLVRHPRVLTRFEHGTLTRFPPPS